VPDWPTAAAFLPEDRSLESLRAAAAQCKGCPLWEPATQTVFSRGPESARLVLIGEQPGDQEDLQGKPFVGPAGRVLVRALDDAAIDRNDVYVTNAVKHFKFTVRGKRRIHATPDAAEAAACRPWLRAELELLKPRLVVLLGATAAKTVYGSGFRVTRQRGAVMDWPVAGGPRAMATIHPSAVLRADDQEAAYTGLVADLRLAAKELA
jgi:uracil-DNA glycosylase family protein